VAATLLRCVGGHGGPSPGRGFRPPLSSYDVVWRDASYPGAEFGTSSMPVGNGDAAANVWWHDGALFALLAKGDAWTEWHDLFKIGRLRIALDPPPPSEANLSLTMSVATASVELRMPGVSARVWMDGPPPLNVLRVELNVTAPTTLSVELQRWRNRTRQWGDAQQGYSFYCPWHNRTTMPPDTIVPPGVGDAGGDGGQEIVWYHRNLGSSWRADLSHQGLGHALNLSADPFLHRTFGGLVEAAAAASSPLAPSRHPLPFVRSDGGGAWGGPRLVSPPPSSGGGGGGAAGPPPPPQRYTVSAYVLTEQTPTAQGWVDAVRALARAGRRRPWAAAWAAHERRWASFWNTSRLDMR
jgi:hypothetical protein